MADSPRAIADLARRLGRFEFVGRERRAIGRYSDTNHAKAEIKRRNCPSAIAQTKERPGKA
ncbi:hypothetical protein [Chitiniphilus shinanonensis]|uniref:hypothetical protein n=1 Tax=Chitiniphilus shinanonensis TaxID=553088 RepID=UPI0012FBE286|nr:hypothetical protein [Chitiniphilus shinanonensis]